MTPPNKYLTPASNHTNILAILLLLTLLFPISMLPSATAQEDSAESDSKANQAALELVLPSLLTVEYTFQYDKGELPRSSHRNGYYAPSVREERPHLEAGFLITDTLLITDDLMVHPRFIDKINVRFGHQIRAATLHAVARGERAITLKLDSPFDPGTAEPLKFNPDAEPPFFVATQHEINGGWSTRLYPFSTGLIQFNNHERIIPLTNQGPIVNAAGECLAVAMSHELPADHDDWKGSPLDNWELIPFTQLNHTLAALPQTSAAGIVRAALRFRSPRKSNSNQFSSYYDDDDDATRTEWNGFAVITDENTALILANLSADATARLENISIFTLQPDGSETEVKATFRGSFKDHTALLATLNQPLSSSAVINFSTEPDLTTLRDRLLIADRAILRGDARSDYYSHARFSGFTYGWKGKTYPDHPGSEGQTFYFDSKSGALLTLPITRRVRLSDDRYGRNDNVLFPVTFIAELLANPEEFFDPNNIPLSEAQENRLAWLGVELQPLDQELARFNNIADQTDDGRFGAMVTHIYDHSPAQKAGLALGDILIRIHSDELPKPAEIDSSGDFRFASQGFPWDRLDEIPDEYFDQIPTPWSPAENNLNTTLTDIGFDNSVRIEYVRDGKLDSIQITIEEGPPHYASAPKFEDESLGLTVRNFTYEVRRYFLKKSTDPGVIVSSIEAGSKISVAGLKPFEIVTAVNDQPVHNIADFERLVNESDELNFSITRMTRGRIVKITRN